MPLLAQQLRRSTAPVTLAYSLRGGLPVDPD